MAKITKLPEPLDTMKESLAGNNAVALINNKFSELGETAHSVENSLEDALGRIGSGVVDLSAIAFPNLMQVQGIEVSADPFTESLDANIKIPSFNENLQLEDVTLSSINVPTFNVTAPAPSYSATPAITEPTEPGEPPQTTATNLPQSPDVDVSPVIKKIDDILKEELPQFPSQPQIDFLTFDAVCSFDDNITPPENLFDFAETPYESKLSDALMNKLTATINNGGEGLGWLAEDVLWERAKDRLADEYEKEITKLNDHWAAAGWFIPAGPHIASLADATNKRMRALEQFSFEAVAEQARLAQNDYHVAVQNGVQFENVLRSFHNAVHDRSLKAAIAATETSVLIYNALAEHNKLKLEKYKTEAAVFEARLRAQLTQLEVYKAQLEAINVRTSVDVARLNSLKTMLDAYESSYRLYASQLDAVRLVLQTDALKLDNFKQQVAIYTAKWQGQLARLQAWTASLDGEKTKVDIYKAQADAFSSQLSAVEAEARIKIAQADVTIKKNSAKVQEYTAKVEGYKAQITGAVEETRAKTDVYKAKAVGYGTYQSAKVAVADAKARTNIAAAKHELSAAMVAIDTQKANLEQSLRKIGLKEEAFKASATLYAQWMASLYAAMNIGASMSDSENTGESISWTYGHGDSVSAGLTETYSYKG